MDGKRHVFPSKQQTKPKASHQYVLHAFPNFCSYPVSNFSAEARATMERDRRAGRTAERTDERDATEAGRAVRKELVERPRAASMTTGYQRRNEQTKKQRGEKKRRTEQNKAEQQGGVKSTGIRAEKRLQEIRLLERGGHDKAWSDGAIRGLEGSRSRHAIAGLAGSL